MPPKKHRKTGKTPRRSHGLSRTPLYKKWHAMMYRCYSENCNAYPLYGGRGIKVCKRWHSVQNFVEDMKPSFVEGSVFDREDPNKGYCPDNCRWVTHRESARNRRRSLDRSLPLGVYQNSAGTKFHAHIKIGSFETSEEAKAAYDYAVSLLKCYEKSSS